MTSCKTKSYATYRRHAVPALEISTDIIVRASNRSSVVVGMLSAVTEFELAYRLLLPVCAWRVVGHVCHR
jgi:hypothetical protein